VGGWLLLFAFAVARERDDFHNLGLVPNACQPRNWRRKPRRVQPLSGVFLCPDTQRKTGRLRAELRYGSTQGTPNLPAQQKTENEQRRQVRRCGFLSSFLALFRAVAVQLFGGAFAFPILSLLSFGYPLPLTYCTAANSITALVKRLQAAASQRKRLPLPAKARANHDKAREDEHGGEAGGGEVHCVACACMESLCQKAPALSQPSRANASITSSGIVARTGHET